MSAGAADVPATAKTLAERLLRSTRDLRGAAEALGTEKAHRRPSPEEWCAAEIVAHAIEIQGYWLDQAQMVASDPGCKFGRTKEDPHRVAWVAEHGSRDLQDLLGDLDRETQRTAEGIRSLTEDELRRVGVHHRRGEMAVGEILQTWVVEHMTEHVEQAREVSRQLDNDEEQSTEDGGRDG